MGTILELRQIQKYYGNEGNITKAINDISFTVEEGEFLGIMGASGSGKTTLLNCISTIDTVSAGHIYLYGQQVKEDGRLTGKDCATDGKPAQGIDITQMKVKELARFRRENLGFIFQDFNLLDTLTIAENIALALAINKVPAGEVEGRVAGMCEKLKIGDILHKYPYQVSGGQKQRCACARALVNHPKLLLADEPTGSVALVQHYQKQIPVMFPSLSTFISSMTDRQRVRFSSRVKVSYIALKSAVKIFLMAAKSGGVSCAGSGSFPSAAVYIS